MARPDGGREQTFGRWAVSLAGAAGTAHVTPSERQKGLVARHVVRSATRGSEDLGPNRKSRFTPVGRALSMSDTGEWNQMVRAFRLSSLSEFIHLSTRIHNAEIAQSGGHPTAAPFAKPGKQRAQRVMCRKVWSLRGDKGIETTNAAFLLAIFALDLAARGTQGCGDASRETEGSAISLTEGPVRILVMSMTGLGLMISECAAQYPSPATPRAQFVQDYYECRQEASDAWQTQRYSQQPIIVPPPNNPSATDPPELQTHSAISAYQAQLFQSCMKARGYKLTQ